MSGFLPRLLGQPSKEDIDNEIVDVVSKISQLLDLNRRVYRENLNTGDMIRELARIDKGYRQAAIDVAKKVIDDCKERCSKDISSDCLAKCIDNRSATELTGFIGKLVQREVARKKELDLLSPTSPQKIKAQRQARDFKDTIPSARKTFEESFDLQDGGAQPSRPRRRTKRRTTRKKRTSNRRKTQRRRR